MLEVTLSQFISNYINDTLKIDSTIEFDKNDILKIISYVLGKNKNTLLFNMNDLYLDNETCKNIKKKLDEFYINNKPLQYIIGIQPFYNEEYIVNENVLVPRSDTEILVEKAVEYIHINHLKSMMDLCCGSGCIGISILNNSVIDSCTLVDISDKALEIANRNIVHNEVYKKVITLKSDLFNEVTGKYDLIVSNPPYIPSKEIETLSEVVKNEPHLALDGGKDGLNMYRVIIHEASNYLNDKGYLMLEIGYNQLEKIKELIKDSDLEFMESVKDYGNNDRVVICRFHQK